jgi:hypothetical protein
MAERICSIEGCDRSAVCRGAHRVSYEHYVGPIPKGLEIDHLCRVRHCVNPAHLGGSSETRSASRQAGLRE